MAAWYRSGGKALIDTIRADNTAIRNAADNKDSTGLRHACDQLLADARAANNYAPIPDNQAQPHWANSLPLIIKGAFDCAGSFLPGYNDLLSTGVEEMNDGVTELNLVVTRINALLG